MKRGLAILALTAVLGVAGCGGGGGGGGDNPVAPGPSNGSIAETEPNDVTPQVLGTLGTTDKLVAGTAGGRNDVDYYRVTLAAPAAIHVALSWTGAQDLEVGISNENGVMIRNQDTPTGNPEQCTVTARPAGTYLVRVGSHSTSAVTYSLTIGQR